MTVRFSGEIWYWRGPAPFYFVTVPPKEAGELKAIERLVTYGWGMIPAVVRVGDTEFKTALWPKDGSYVVPLKDKVRKAENLHEGDTVTLSLDIAD